MLTEWNKDGENKKEEKEEEVEKKAEALQSKNEQTEAGDTE